MAQRASAHSDHSLELRPGWFCTRGGLQDDGLQDDSLQANLAECDPTDRSSKDRQMHGGERFCNGSAARSAFAFCIRLASVVSGAVSAQERIEAAFTLILIQ